MNLKQLHTMLLITLCAALAACSDQDVLVDDITDAHTPIELSVGGVDAPSPTRAVITDNPYNPHNFTYKTRIFMVMKSEYGYTDYEGSHTTKYTVTRGDVDAETNAVKFDSYNQRYWDDAHARSSELSIWAYAQQAIPEISGWLQCTFEEPDPDWDGSNPLKEYKEATFLTYNHTNPWIDEDGSSKGAIYPCIMTWKASHNNDLSQDANSIKYQDLLFSNNLVNYNTDDAHPENDHRLKFNFSTRKFPQSGDAQMKFYHAMSKITIHIKKGEGFGSQFAFTTGNVCLKKLNTVGTFNIKDGEFQQVVTPCVDIPQMYNWDTPATGDAFTLEALAIPNIHEFLSTHDGSDVNSRFLKEANNLATDVMMEFVIENNKYQLTSAQLYDALMQHDGNGIETTPVTNATRKTDNGSTYIPLEPGKNYVFTFTIGKSKISNITAQVADWENVSADPQNLTNARIKLQLEERGTPQTEDVAFYSKSDHKTTVGIDDNYATYNWETGFSNMSATYSVDHWTTNLFWHTNKEFYHFRALMPDETAVTTESTEGDYAALASGSAYTDVRWGAPMKDDGDNETAGTFKWTYDPTTNGFDNAGHTQIYKAIGATENPIKLILFHMMSDLTFNIKTTSDADAVTLVDGVNKTKVEIVGFYPGGKVLLGTGLVKTTGDKGTQEVAWNTESPSGTHVYKYGAVPQGLTDVVLRVTTPDNNQYIVDLAGVKATTISTNNIANPYTQGSDSKYTIDRWYPGFMYNYSFTLKKTGITNLQATIVQWETVEADDETVQIK